MSAGRPDAVSEATGTTGLEQADSILIRHSPKSLFHRKPTNKQRTLLNSASRPMPSLHSRWSPLPLWSYVLSRATLSHAVILLNQLFQGHPGSLCHLSITVRLDLSAASECSEDPGLKSHFSWPSHCCPSWASFKCYRSSPFPSPSTS